MEFVKKLEVTLTGWYKQVPFHLPAGGRKWLGANVWWIVLIGAIASVLSIIGGINAYMWAQEVGYLGYYNTLPNTTSIWVGAVFYVAVAVLEIMAISPLKKGQKKGWDLLFMAMLVSALSVVVTAAVAMRLGGVLSAAVGLAIGGYFLFEIHERFNGAKKVTRASKNS